MAVERRGSLTGEAMASSGTGKRTKVGISLIVHAWLRGSDDETYGLCLGTGTHGDTLVQSCSLSTLARHLIQETEVENSPQNVSFHHGYLR